MSIYEPNTAETADGVNHDWAGILSAISNTSQGLCVSGCGKRMAKGAEGLCLDCGREMWKQELEDAADGGNVLRGLQVVGWYIEMERAA